MVSGGRPRAWDRDLHCRDCSDLGAGLGAAGCSGGSSSPEVVEGHRQYRRKAALRHQLTQRGPVPSVWNFLNQQLIIQVTKPALPCNLWAHRWHSVFEILLVLSIEFSIEEALFPFVIWRGGEIPLHTSRHDRISFIQPIKSEGPLLFLPCQQENLRWANGSGWLLSS